MDSLPPKLTEAIAKCDIATLTKLPKTMLVNACQHYGLPDTGPRDVLAERLLEYFECDQVEQRSTRSRSSGRALGPPPVDELLELFHEIRRNNRDLELADYLAEFEEELTLRFPELLQ